MNIRANALNFARILRTKPPEGGRRTDSALFPVTPAAGLLHAMTGKFPSPGSVCSLKDELGGWRDGCYYAPPLVLTIAEVTSGLVRVAQLHEDAALAAPDSDIMVPPERAGGLAQFFVEKANCYHLDWLKLDRIITVIDSDTLQNINRAIADPLALPEWSPLLPPIKGSNDPRVAFRQLEQEVASFFRASPFATLMAASREKLAGAFEKLGVTVSKIIESGTQASIIHALLPEGPLAAQFAADNTTAITALAISFSGGVPGEIMCLRAEAPTVQLTGTTLTVSGVLLEKLPLPPEEWLPSFAWLAPGQGEIFTSVREGFAREGFWAEFKLPSAEYAKNGRLSLRFIRSGENEASL